MFLDASVLIVAVERPNSNASAVVRAGLRREFEAVVDEVVLEEVGRYLRKRSGRSVAWLYCDQIRRNIRVLSKEECKDQWRRLATGLKPADRLHVAACRTARAEVLIAIDSDFDGIPEYRTPRDAAVLLGIAPRPSLW